MAERPTPSRGRAVPGALRPKPFRGDQVAAGAVVLTTLVALLLVRFDGEWPAGVLLGLAVAAFAFVLALAAGAPAEGDGPARLRDDPARRGLRARPRGAARARARHRRAARAGFGDGRCGRPCRSPPWRPGSPPRGAPRPARCWRRSARRWRPWRCWTGSSTSAPAGCAGPCSPPCWCSSTASLSQRDRRRPHAVQLVNAGGLALLALALTWLVPAYLGDGGTAPGWGWQLFVLAGAFGLVADAAVDQERGSALLGVAALAAFTALASEGDLLGWPIALAAMAAVMLVIGLRPTTPAPPEPGAGEPSPPPVVVRPRGEPPIEGL